MARSYLIRLKPVTPLGECLLKAKNLSYLIADGVPRLIDLLKHAFTAEERGRINTENGRVGHAEVKIGGSVGMMGLLESYVQPDTKPTLRLRRKCRLGSQPRPGSRRGSEQEPTSQFYGDRTAAVKDPAGNVWWIATHVEDVSPADVVRRMKEQGPQGRRSNSHCLKALRLTIRGSSSVFRASEIHV